MPKPFAIDVSTLASDVIKHLPEFVVRPNLFMQIGFRDHLANHDRTVMMLLAPRNEEAVKQIEIWIVAQCFDNRLDRLLFAQPDQRITAKGAPIFKIGEGRSLNRRTPRDKYALIIVRTKDTNFSRSNLTSLTRCGR